MRNIGHTLGGLALACLALATPTPGRATPLDDYLKARDAYVAKFDPGEKQLDYDKISKAHDAALADLEKMTRGMIGAVEINGADAGKINLGSLVKGDIDVGKLDGLVYKLDGGKTEVVVSTRGLLAKWLAEHKDWWGKKTANVPQALPQALAFEGLYTQALSGDAAVSRYADLPVTKPAGAEIAVAMLDLRDQNVGVGKPDEIIAARVSGETVYIVSSPIAGKPTAFAVCDAQWKTVERKAAKTTAKTTGDTALKLEEDGAAAYRACYAEKLKPTPAFASLTAQAQKLIDGLPTR